MIAQSLRPMANVDGAISPLEEASVSVLDRGFLYGDSIYEVFRTYSGVPLFCHEHMDRMENSAALIHMTLGQTREEILGEIRRTIEAAEPPSGEDVYVRWHVTRGGGPVDLVPQPDAETRLVVLVKPVPKWNPEHYSHGMRVAVTSVRRNAADALNPDIKSGNYLNNILAVSEAIELGADDCVMLNAAGHVTEASTSNVFFVLDGELVTPSPASGILRGITKWAIEQMSEREGFPVGARELSVDDLADVSECFVTSSTREVMPVASLMLSRERSLDLPGGGGPVTRRVAAAYKAAVDEYVDANAALRLF
ncbi:MAG: aminotransferase class IV [Planctomycetota bacterium]